MLFRRIALAVLLACAGRPALAQEAPDEAPRSLPGWSLRRTMREFVNAYDPLGFFPSRGDWNVVLTTHYRVAPDRMGVWRVPAAQSDSASDNGLLRDVFPFGEYAYSGGIIDNPPDVRERPWRRVSPTRYVAPGRSARSPVFVEWRREDGRWVVASLGMEREHWTPLLGRGVDEAVPGAWVPLRLPLPDTARVAAGEPWFEKNEPITVAGHRLVKYGLPRALQESDVVRWGTLWGVGVYVEPTPYSRVPEVVYLPVDRAGSFQPYQDER